MPLVRWLRTLIRKPVRRSQERVGVARRPAADHEKVRRFYEDKMLRLGDNYQDKSA